MDGFPALERTIERVLSIRCTQYKEEYIRRRVASRMRVTEQEGFEEYHRYLLSHPHEQQELRNALTINVTRFFRDPEVFEIIRREILPRLAARVKRVHIWVAGCSTGEEAYSMAILLHEASGLRGDLSGVIYATDIDNQALMRAKEGLYDARSMEDMDSGRIKRHFARRDDGRYEVGGHLRELVRFRSHDLMTGIPVSRLLDLVSCRNVTIYFSEGQKTELARMFHGSLRSGGYYVMGKTEYLGRDVEHLFTPYNAPEKVYQKR
jgi:chemotaxis protein methyltransferase CheR